MTYSSNFQLIVDQYLQDRDQPDAYLTYLALCFMAGVMPMTEEEFNEGFS